MQSRELLQKMREAEADALKLIDAIHEAAEWLESYEKRVEEMNNRIRYLKDLADERR